MILTKSDQIVSLKIAYQIIMTKNLKSFVLVSIIVSIFFVLLHSCNSSTEVKVYSFEDATKYLPIEQRELLRIFNSSYREYAEKKGNDALESLVKEKQTLKLCSFFEKNSSFIGWHGRVSEINSYNGKFSLRINMNFDNEKYNTLYLYQDDIDKNSNLYKSLIKIAPKDLIIFSGEVRVQPTELEYHSERVSDTLNDVLVAVDRVRDAERGREPSSALNNLPTLPKCKTFRQKSDSLEQPIIFFVFSDIKLQELPKK